MFKSRCKPILNKSFFPPYKVYFSPRVAHADDVPSMLRVRLPDTRGVCQVPQSGVKFQLWYCDAGSPPSFILMLESNRHCVKRNSYRKHEQVWLIGDNCEYTDDNDETRTKETAQGRRNFSCINGLPGDLKSVLERY